MLRSILFVLILKVSLVCLPIAAQDKSRSLELIQYVRGAQKAGLTDGQIEENAVKAGWPAANVQEVLAQVRSLPQGDAAKAQASDAQAPAAAEGAVAIAASSGVPTAALNAKEQPALPTERSDGAPTGGAPVVQKNRGVPDDYQIGAGDVLQIAVWKEPDASIPHAVVRPDGKISLPLLKEVQVVGLTPAEVEKIVTAQLARFITAPDVSVIVTGINSKKVYVVGAVKKEGPISYTYRMSVMQAISEAGGVTDYAKRKRIYVLRNENGREYKLQFDYDAVLKGEHMELNIPLEPGDTLVVPK